MERLLGRSLSDETNARPLTWGKIVEGRVFELLGLEYSLSSSETDPHPTIEYWSGSKDGKKEGVEGGCIIEIKCPITLKSFCQLVQPLYQGLTGSAAMDSIRENHKDGEKYYWQCVSNAVINNTKHAELIVYMPYFSELVEIKKMADGIPNAYFITMGGDDELPYLIDGGYYKNLNIISFEVPQSDKEALTANVLKAGKMLLNPANTTTTDTAAETTPEPAETTSANSSKPVLL
jgi:hypothetical protein